jgi:uncharacterized protein (TIGR02996 family)
MARRKGLEEAFLGAIAEAPEDDLPRLAYADWLDEHGDPDRAEFIRVQCELARLEPSDPRREPLSERERVLLNAQGAKWTACLGPLAGTVRWLFRRGMLEEVGIEEGTGNDELWRLRFLPALRGLGLFDPAITDDGLAHLKELNNLLVFSPGISNVTDAGCLHLLLDLPKLVLIQDDEELLSEEAKGAFRALLEQRFLRLPAEDQRAAAVEYVSWQSMRSCSAKSLVREVCIHDRHVFDEDLIFFTALPELELLEIHEANSVTSAGLRHLTGLKRLRSLTLSATGVSSIDALAALTHLECLRLAGIRSLDFDAAAALEGLTNLRQLELTWCDVSDEALRRLARLDRLEELDLYQTVDGRISDEGVEALRGLSRLRVLKLAGHQGVTDRGLASLRGLTRLEILDLSETGITDAGLAHLHGLKELEYFDAHRTAVSIGGARTLATALPKVLIVVANRVIRSPRGEVCYSRRDVDGRCTLEIGDHWEVREWEVREGGAHIEVSIHLREDGFQRVPYFLGAEVRFYRQTVPEAMTARDLLMLTVTGLCNGHRLSGADADVSPLSGTDVASQRYYQHDMPYIAFSWVRNGQGYTLNCYVQEPRWAEWEPVFLRMAHSFRWLDGPG